jgi:hypothetical protein
MKLIRTVAVLPHQTHSNTSTINEQLLVPPRAKTSTASAATLPAELNSNRECSSLMLVVQSDGSKSLLIEYLTNILAKLRQHMLTVAGAVERSSVVAACQPMLKCARR